MNGDHILEKISNQDILRYPYISLYILEYIQERYPNSNLPYLSPNILTYPKEISTIISLAISTNDILMVSYHILVYPILISLWDIFNVILFIHPVISLLSLFYILGSWKYPWWYPIMISFTYPNISMWFIHTWYPFDISIELSYYILGIYPLVAFFGGLSFGALLFLGSHALPISFDILWYPFTQLRKKNA